MKSLTLRSINGRTSLLFVFFLLMLSGFSFFLHNQNRQIRSNYLKMQKNNAELPRRNEQLVLWFMAQQNFMLEFSHNGSEERKKTFNTMGNESILSIQATRKYLDSIGIAQGKNYCDSLILSVQEMQRNGNVLMDYIIANKSISQTQFKAKNDSLTTVYYHQNVKAPISTFFNSFFPLRQIGFDQEKQINDELNRLTNRILLVIVLVTALSVLSIIAAWWYFYTKLNKSIQKPKEILDVLATGELTKKQEVPHDELGSIVQTANILSDNIRSASEFAEKIGQGDFHYAYTPISEKDVLGNALLNMRDELQAYNTREKTMNWTNEGLAHFANLLRNSQNDLSEMCQSLLSGIIKYLQVNQGSLFLTNADATADPHLTVVASYAYDRKKYTSKTIAIGEGLVGQCYLERGIIYLTDIPHNYVHITSGLGGATPTSLLLVPIQTDAAIEGILELASFREFQEHEIKFIEKVCENMASVISFTKLNQQTRTLLEGAQQQAEEMRAQQEEMHQNLEELSATQEEMNRREMEYKQKIQELESQQSTSIL